MEIVFVFMIIVILLKGYDIFFIIIIIRIYFGVMVILVDMFLFC